MENFLLECAKVGGVLGAAFAILLWKTLQDKDRMAKEMNADKRDLIAAYKANTEAFSDLKNTLGNRPCLASKPHGDTEKNRKVN